MKYFKTLKEYIIKLSKKGLSPSEIAFAVALGNFIGFIPLIGTHTLIAFGLAYVLRLNPLIVFLSTQISNPISYPFQIFISAEVGNLILKGSFIKIKFSKDMNYLTHYVWPIIVGSQVLGVIVSGMSYLLINYFLSKRRGRT